MMTFRGPSKCAWFPLFSKCPSIEFDSITSIPLTLFLPRPKIRVRTHKESRRRPRQNAQTFLSGDKHAPTGVLVILTRESVQLQHYPSVEDGTTRLVTPPRRRGHALVTFSLTPLFPSRTFDDDTMATYAVTPYARPLEGSVAPS
ncbi:hypothetical protein GW17_00048322 [Ensete ventricosum]|nr:hypothetical protein GW17_00048322 [Ensete ventricosum]